jgi:tRNA A-37 threonylcarbamoyl transferase component Bud32
MWRIILNRSNTKLVVAVDFDGTLALGNKSHITISEPNFHLIKRLKDMKEKTNCYIKIITARGSKGKLSEEEKIKKYKHLIRQFLDQYEIPYDEISFTKEYADIYIDDMTIGQHDPFISTKSEFTDNSIIITNNTVVKKCSTALFEREWYDLAKGIVFVPDVLFVNDETIITSKICGEKPTIKDYINLLTIFKNNKIINFPFFTYTENITIHKHSTNKTIDIVKNLPIHNGTFFHGDLCPGHVLMKGDEAFLIDPNYKRIFGSYLTDAGKLFFSLIAYEQNYRVAEEVANIFGEDVIKFAVAEGLRVCKYKERYISIVNNISDLLP